MVRTSGKGERCPARLLSACARSCGAAALAWGRGGTFAFWVNLQGRGAVAALVIAAVGGGVCILSTGRERILWDICGSDDFEMLWGPTAAQL